MKGRVALLDQKKLNLGVTVFVSVKTNQHTKGWLSQFAKAVRSIPEIVEVYRMAGDVDYLLKVVAPDIEGYDSILQTLDRSRRVDRCQLLFRDGADQGLNLPAARPLSTRMTQPAERSKRRRFS